MPLPTIWQALLIAEAEAGFAKSASEADTRLTRRVSEGSRLLQIQVLDHVIVGGPVAGQPGSDPQLRA